VRSDRELGGPAKDKLAEQIDRVAHQKYATVTRLYWHTDADSALNQLRLRPADRTEIARSVSMAMRCFQDRTV